MIIIITIIINVHTNEYVKIYIVLCVSIYIYIYIYTHNCIYIYIYIYIHIAMPVLSVVWYCAEPLLARRCSAQTLSLSPVLSGVRRCQSYILLVSLLLLLIIITTNEKVPIYIYTYTYIQLYSNANPSPPVLSPTSRPRCARPRSRMLILSSPLSARARHYLPHARAPRPGENRASPLRRAALVLYTCVYGSPQFKARMAEKTIKARVEGPCQTPQLMKAAPVLFTCFMLLCIIVLSTFDDYVFVVCQF